MSLAAGEGGLPKAVLRSADGTATAELYRHGATLTSWAVGGRELLFVSPKAAFAPPKAIRGGVPVCFPQFGMLGPCKSQHGFARQMEWEVEELTDSSCTMVLGSSEETKAIWPHDFELRLTVSLLGSGALKQVMAVKNSGSQPFDFTCALHTYFKVSDVSKASVVGLKGLQYVDNPSGGLLTDNKAAVTFPGEVDRAYLAAPDTLKLTDSGSCDGGSVLMIHKHGFPDAVVWNPAEAKAASMADLGAENWRQFVCVEVAQARSGAIKLGAGQEWEGSTTVEYDTMGES